ncbi:MAG: hypothetical protein A2W90_24285 [Bacteroidetes bacterium GWF2_42_66]|nr:MAG: hypothetical protein A2W92_08950 [Bacteroidetes bacterium GWA2_42_15]OFX97954.1 MAG: hypothetical protein A2W89_07815 [Bacteroidetes bacterium GWE2_42_39]OFY45809.1 MAG: hypothetical protein A2W90_24285 [Bacteroidetes bacterium GWF2_42_66]
MEKYLIIPSRTESTNKLELFLQDFFDELKLKKDNFFHVLLSLSESVNNSISHGNKFNENKNVIISCSWENEILTITVEDEGNGFEINDIKDPTLPENIFSEQGRGLFLISRLTDEFSFIEKGRIMELKFKIKSEYQFL